LIPRNDPRSAPELVDPDIKDPSSEYPGWIHPHEPGKRLWYITDRVFASQVENNFDVAITSGVSGLLAANLFGRIPVVHMSLGSEVTELPLFRYQKWDLYKCLLSYLARRALTRVDRILSGFSPTIQTIHVLGIEKKLKLWGFPEDVVCNRLRVDTAYYDKLMATYSRYHRVFMWLSRVNYLDKTSSAYKGAENLLDAFENIAREHGDQFIMIIGEHGVDINSFKKMVAERELNRWVHFIPHLSYQKLLSYLSLPNAVVFDELDSRKGELSGVAREALSVGTIVVKALDNDLIELCFGPDCPVVNAYDAPSCQRAMKDLLENNEEYFKKLKKANQSWAAKYLHYEHNVSKLISLIQEIVFCNRLSKS